jgi:hypothetical protein
MYEGLMQIIDQKGEERNDAGIIKISTKRNNKRIQGGVSMDAKDGG